jgi:hypothetical protein
MDADRRRREREQQAPAADAHWFNPQSTDLRTLCATLDSTGPVYPALVFRTYLQAQSCSYELIY